MTAPLPLAVTELDPARVCPVAPLDGFFLLLFVLLLASDRVASRDYSGTERQLEIDVVTVKEKRATHGHAHIVACQGGFKTCLMYMYM